MSIGKPPVKSNATSSLQAVLGVLPFMAYGLVSISNHFGNAFLRPPIWLHPFLIFDALVLIGLGAGILAGFPRWAYSYLAWALIMAWWLSDMGMYGYRLDNRMWLLLLGIFILALLAQRSLESLRALITGLWNDWTLFSLGMYSLFAWLGVMYDENHHPYLLVFIIASTLAVCAGAWFYFQQTAATRRVWSLIAGLVTLIVISGINSATWDWRAYYNLPEDAHDLNPVGAAFFTLILVLMYLTGYITQKRQTREHGL
jgi:hypothetical protein